MKTFFGGVFIEKIKLMEAGVKYPIKLEYFKTKKEKKNVEANLGIEVVKTEFLDDKIKVETKEVNYITADTSEQERILTLLKDNEVTPIAVEDVLQEIL